MYKQFLPRFLTMKIPGPADGLEHTDGLCLSLMVLQCYCKVADGYNFVVPCIYFITFNFISFHYIAFHFICVHIFSSPSSYKKGASNLNS